MPEQLPKNNFKHAETLYSQVNSELNYIYDLATNSNKQLSRDLDLSISSEVQKTFKRYGERELINHGGMKDIYRVEDTVTGRAVAFATPRIENSKYSQEAFLREARLTALLEHPYIMPVYDIGIDNEQLPYFTMKLTGGQNLNDQMSEVLSNKLDWPLLNRLNIFTSICEGIAYAHSQNIVHMDLKPHNIQVGEFGEVLICDWGLAKVIFEEENLPIFDKLDPRLTGEMTIHGQIKGTPGFMAPEQIDTKHGKRNELTDIYALGGLLYFLLTGTPPVSGETVQDILTKTSEGQVTQAKAHSPQFQIPIALKAIALKALNSSPGERYQSVEELKGDVDAYLNGFATSAEEAGLSRTIFLLIKRHRIISTVLSLALLFATLFMVYFKFSEEKSKQLKAKYTNEKKLSTALKKVAIKELTDQAGMAMHLFDFTEANKLIDKALKLDSESYDASKFKARLLFFDQQFNASAKEFERITKYKVNPLYKLAVEYGKLKPDKQRLEPAQFKKLLIQINQYWLQRPFLGNERLNRKDLATFMEYVYILFAHLNKKQKPLNFKFTQKNGKNYLDLSGNPNLKELHMSTMTNIPLHYLNIDGLTISDYNARKLSTMPLIELSMVGPRTTDLSFTEKIPTLKKITLRKDLYPPYITNQLKKHMTVILK